MRAITAAPQLRIAKRAESTPTLPTAAIASAILPLPTMTGIRCASEDKRRYYGIDAQRFTAKDVIYDEKDRSCRCRAGNRLYGNGTHIKIHAFIAMKFSRSQIGMRTLSVK